MTLVLSSTRGQWESVRRSRTWSKRVSGPALAGGVELRSNSGRSAEWSDLHMLSHWRGERMRGGSSILCFPLYLAPAYVAAAKAAREIDGVHCRIGACLRLRPFAAESSYIEDAAAIGNELAAPDCGSGMDQIRRASCRGRVCQYG